VDASWSMRRSDSKAHLCYIVNVFISERDEAPSKMAHPKTSLELKKNRDKYRS
jgi:hypothetical protein